MKKILLILLLINAAWGADLPSELPTIRIAADRNGCYGDDLILLLAIRQAENGRPSLEFGIMNPKANSLDKQAGWCAATIMNHHRRTNKTAVTPEFIASLGQRYCPIGADNDNGTNKHWVKNVSYWFGRLKNAN